MPDSAELRQNEDVGHLMRGARNAARACLAVSDRDVATLIADEASARVAAALLAALEEEGARVHAFVLERHAPRPVEQLPPEIRRALGRSTVSLYTCHPQEGEVGHRMELVELVRPLGLRHAHMISITEDGMLQGMLSDYRQVAALNRIMIDRVRRARRVEVTTRRGTSVVVALSPAEPFDSSAGVIEPGHWYNLPNGEILTCPAAVDGVFVCDGVVPVAEQVDRFDIGRSPLEMTFADGRLTELSGGPGDLAERVYRTVRGGENLDRVGMFAVGTNFELLMPIGNALQDLFIPGAYFSLGRSPGSGARPPSWEASAQLTFTARKTSLVLDGAPVINEGRYDPIVLDEAARALF